MIAIAIAVFLASGVPPDAARFQGEGEEMPFTKEMRDDYESRFRTATVRPEFRGRAGNVVTQIVKSRERYETVTSRTKVPWYVVGVIHSLECSGDFNCHLHNGDPLRRRTVNVPAGRPVTGKPPFSWEDSATDALTFDGFTSWTDWSVGGTLYKLEGYNGMGYRKRGVPTPYLWSGSQHYTRGKYVADGRFDPKAVSAQLGAAVVLKKMDGEALIDMPSSPAEGATPASSETSSKAAPLAGDHDCAPRR